jgi:hypothetical protein
MTAPVRPFTTLCLSCWEIDRVTSATDGERVIYVCAACGAVATAKVGEIPKVVFE